MVERRNRLVQGKLEQELLCLRSLPPAPVPEYVNYQSKVRKWCTIQVAGHSYSVTSRLIGKEVQIRLYADWAEVVLQGPTWWNAWHGCVARGKPTSITATSSAHWCASLVPSPATASGSSCFPPCTSASHYDALRQWRGERADVEYVRILHLAATTMEATVDSALSLQDWMAGESLRLRGGAGPGRAQGSPKLRCSLCPASLT